MRILVHVHPNARTTRVGGRYGDSEPPILVVRVSAPAQQGKANAATIDALAQALDLSLSSIHIVAGQGSRTKVIELEGVDSDKIEALLHQ
jgi:uncharacterized protein YggU (UPF0235/DUF167 family)